MYSKRIDQFYRLAKGFAGLRSQGSVLTPAFENKSTTPAGRREVVDL
jgi:hypothetical protein